MNKATGRVMKLVGLEKSSVRMTLTGAEWDGDVGDTKQVEGPLMSPSKA